MREPLPLQSWIVSQKAVRRGFDAFQIEIVEPGTKLRGSAVNLLASFIVERLLAQKPHRFPVPMQGANIYVCRTGANAKRDTILR